MSARRVLVVDDSPLLLAMVRDTLSKAGFEVTTACDGLDGVNATRAQLPDLVITDVEMPALTGLQLCRLLQNDPLTSTVPILMLSAHTDQHEKYWGRESGAIDYLPKPFGPDRLLERVQEILARTPANTPPAKEAPPDPLTLLQALERHNAILERQLFELTVIHGIGEAAAVTAAPREAVRGALQQLSSVLDYHVALLAGTGMETSYFAVRAATNVGALEALRSRAQQILGASENLPVEPTIVAGAELVTSDASPQEQSLASQLLRIANRTIGVLVVARPAEYPFTHAEQELLGLVAAHTALVTENVRLVAAEQKHLEVLQNYSLHLEATVAERTEALQQALQNLVDAHLDTMHRLAIAAEFRDPDTAAHIRRISAYSALIAEDLQLPTSEVEAIRHASPMHDVGKIGIPDNILLKPGPLNSEEFKTMTKHTLIGARILANSNARLLNVAEQIALTHHERWDGTGYPHGLRGEEIPLPGRICAIADVFDALTTRRPYKDPFPPGQVSEILVNSRGTHFDPALLDRFMELLPEAFSIQESCCD